MFIRHVGWSLLLMLATPACSVDRRSPVIVAQRADAEQNTAGSSELEPVGMDPSEADTSGASEEPLESVMLPPEQLAPAQPEEPPAPAAQPGECMNGACAPACTPGVAQCTSATERQTCTEEGRWATPTACDFACVGGECSGECAATERRCHPESGLPQACGTTAFWEDQPECGACGECVDAGECSPLPNDCSSLACGPSPSGCYTCGACAPSDTCAGGTCGCTPQVARSALTPALPGDLKVTCMLNGQDLTSSPDCPVVTCGGISYFALSFIDNRVSLAIVGYDAAGNIVSRIDRSGTRYVWDIDVSFEEQTITFWGQADAAIVLLIHELWQ